MRLIAMLREVHENITEWGAAQWRADRAACAHTVCAAAELTLATATAALAKARQATENMVGLLQIWAAAPGPVIRLATRPEWLLDGWEQICHIWNYARDDAAQCAALIEIIEQIPAMPREIGEWGRDASDTVAHLRVMRDAEWRNGATAYDLIARNEHFRAIAL